ncbi:sporulation-specific diadenylate cyclase CdaS [Sporosarcina sp. ACRSL]|uniref:sporulation-specific diadenylate cyclase CdaS n=1 Tax=Sporosarcina sp. ACRSL TaxID=2918215 RepID=UPI001EF6735F|nr:sporulation-specific diadenylate cyclase CdaS [Sporosarcina sp. ACRSL]MCG7343820.1 sporulation-specific diadenylate cyclase CdaS [Sporosarcina sp. ACRSL]
MEEINCDFSPMKQILIDDIHQLISKLQGNAEAINDDNNCLLGKFEKIKEDFLAIEMKAATFYLNCYLSPFTDKYPELSVCVQNMSRLRHGGLIVIQREDPLDSLVNPGIPIGAELTHTLLESIFFPGSPLHDGAVMVHQNRIISATNVLPLSGRFAGDRKLGTRHRAALGLTEQSDALVLVVSEETGRVSFAFKGELYPVMSRVG